MKKIFNGSSLKVSDILTEIFIDIHGHEIQFEKTGKFQYSSVYHINCNCKYEIDLSPLKVNAKEIKIPSDQVVYNDNYYPNNKQNQESRIVKK
ncbi:MAG: hypothetical protein R2685_02740 [Candidatus Nitrosocosmicus sp.]|jgi:hypothetical protein|nr:hypothetical protein [Candidatus Nitrosocosmicus sp.]